MTITMEKINNMQLVIVDDYQTLSQLAANKVIEVINNSKAKSVLGLATGHTPVGMYDELVQAYNKRKFSFKNVVTFNLDEYFPIDTNHPLSFTNFMNQQLFDKVDIPKSNTHIPLADKNVTQQELELFYQQYEQLIQQHGGIDLQILGIGNNGHIGFNEPGTSFNSRTHQVQLTEATIKANELRENGLQVDKAITMGIATIMESKEILLLASGEDKAEIVKRLIEEKPNESMPASILKQHPNVTIVLDKEAARLM